MSKILAESFAARLLFAITGACVILAAQELEVVPAWDRLGVHDASTVKMLEKMGIDAKTYRRIVTEKIADVNDGEGFLKLVEISGFIKNGGSLEDYIECKKDGVDLWDYRFYRNKLHLKSCKEMAKWNATGIPKSEMLDAYSKGARTPQDLKHLFKTSKMPTIN